MTIDTTGSAIDTVMAVYRGTCADLTCVASDDDGGGDLTSSIELCTLPLVKYYVAVWAKGGGAGDFTVNLTCGSPCEPSPIPGKRPITLAGGQAATVEGAEPGQLDREAQPLGTFCHRE